MAEPEPVDLSSERRRRDRHQTSMERIRVLLKHKLDGGDSSTWDPRKLQERLIQIDSVALQGSHAIEILFRGEVDEDLTEADLEASTLFTITTEDTRILCKTLVDLNKASTMVKEIDGLISDVALLQAEEPDVSYSKMLTPANELLDKLKTQLRASSIDSDHKLCITARELTRSLMRLQVDRTVTPTTDSKDFPRRGDGDSTFKLPKINLPKFQGGLENWHSYWGRFKTAVHDNDRLNPEAKMAHLMETITEPAISEYLTACNDGTGRYPEMIAYLKERFDQPRELHRIYCHTLADMQPIKGTQAELAQAADKVFAAVSGLIRHGQDGIKAIATSLVASILPKPLRTEWETKTERERDVPDIFDWIKFVRTKSINAGREQRTSGGTIPQEPKRPNKPQPSKVRGAAHVAVTQPTKQPVQQQAPQPASNQSQSPSFRGRNSQKQSKGSYPACRYQCPLCNDLHYAFSCSSFDSMTVVQRREHVRTQSLCENCLKPGHSLADCRSDYKCKVCKGNHNTLIHPNSSAPAAQANTGTTNHATASADSKEQGMLLMTCQVLVTGPSGRSMLVRTLLDSGSTLSLITNKVAKHLALKKLDTKMAVSALGDVVTETSCPLTPVTISSLHKEGWSHEMTAVITQKISGYLPMQGASGVRDLPNIKGLDLADPYFDSPGRIDMLLGEDVLSEVLMLGGPKGSATAIETVFGWAIRGPYVPDRPGASRPATVHLAIKEPVDTPKEPTDPLVRFWLSEEPGKPASACSPEEEAIQQQYADTHVFLPSVGKYQVTLPKKGQDLILGESRSQAVKRFHSYERSLLQKGNWKKFQDIIQEYLDLGHAQQVTEAELKTPVVDCYYLPMHGVSKESSSTTKFRVVFDASASTSTKHSLNDTLAVGPTLHPPLDEILLRFRTYRVALSGDISKMYREILLSPADRHLHRFVWRPQPDQPLTDFCMNRVTFGVASSPYLAVRTLQQASKDFSTSANASWHVLNSFYVDDLLGGADSVEEALVLYKDLKQMLADGGFNLRKWRSNSAEVLSSIPASLVEPMPKQDLVDMHSAKYPKALGVSWDSGTDTMSTHIELSSSFVSTKRGIISDVARTFDVLGWLAPAILPMKILFQELWERQLDWDDEVPDALRLRHIRWREELPQLCSIKLPRCYFRSDPAVTVELHGFSDASEAAFSAVIYIRATYACSLTTCRLVVAKTRVAPLKIMSIPRLELAGATLLAKVLTTTREALSVPLEQVHAWSDSSIVLAWLDGAPKRYKTYIGNRIATVTSLVPSQSWRHVPTLENPADCASRGLSPSELSRHDLWWNGPPWLLADPIVVPKQPHAADLAVLREEEVRPSACHVTTSKPAEWLELKYSSFRTLLHVTAWVKCFAHNFLAIIQGHPPVRKKQLDPEDVTAAELFLLKASQARSFPAELAQLKSKPPQPISSSSTLLRLHPFLGLDGLLHVGGRLSQSPIPTSHKFPVIISSQDSFTNLVYKYYHVFLGHCGPSLLLSHTGSQFHVSGARQLARSVCSKCVVCRKASAKVENQLMGQLPAARTTPDHPFATTGIDFAGPFTLKLGHTRKPVLVKAYLAIFVCFCTKAVHVEAVSDLTTEAFLATLKRFIARRGLPRDIHSDNGSNFIGARNDLYDLYRFMDSPEVQSSLHNSMLTQRIQWHTIPERAPHFGGLWEAAVKSTKHHLKRVVGQQRLSFEELTTVAAQVEAFLNSRPLGSITSHDPDGITPLTPGHFLVGRPLESYPETEVGVAVPLCKRWNLCQAITQQFWKRWAAEYLQQLQKSSKWHKQTPNLKPGDLVLMTDGNKFHTQWTMGKVVNTYPGKDQLIRAVDVQTETVISPPSTTNKTVLAKQLKTKKAIYRRPISKLALLLPVTGDQTLTRTLEETDQTLIRGPDKHP